jgi:uncharacterized damage-inducible protein DinB
MSMLRQYRLLGHYNRLMNSRLYGSAALLPERELHRDAGAFFRSVMGTLNHLLVGDVLWLKRFASHEPWATALSYVVQMPTPPSLDAQLFGDFQALREERGRVDDVITGWLAVLSEADLRDSLTYRSMAGQTFRKPVESLINHLFLHQVHHRGQVTTLLSQAGVDFGDTDLLELIDEVGQ